MSAARSWLGVALALLACDRAGNAGAAIHATGARVTAGGFTLAVVWEGYTLPADPAVHDGFAYLNDPQGLLFDLIASAQEQFASLARANADFEIAINFPDEEREEGGEDEAARGIIYVNALKSGQLETVRSVPFTVLTRAALRDAICPIWPVPDCPASRTRGPDAGTYLHRAKRRHPPRVFPKVPNLVLFGALPDPEMSGVFVLRPEPGRERHFERLKVTPADMPRHFDRLEP